MEKSANRLHISLIQLIILVAVGHFVIDFMLSIWPVYKTMAGLDLSTAGFIAAGSMVIGELMQLYFGKLIDRGYQKWLLIFGPLLASAAVLFPYVGSYNLFFMLILLTCLGSAAFHPTAASLLSAIDTPKKALLLGFFQTAGNFGMCVGQFFFAQTYEILSGHTAILILPVVLFALLIWFFPSPAKLAKQTIAEKVSFKVLLTFFRSRPLRYLYFIQVSNQTILWSTVFLLPDFLLARSAPSWVVFGGGHFVFLLGATLICIPISMIGDRISHAKAILACFIPTLFLYYFILATPALSTPVLLTLLFIMGGFLGSATPLSYALGAEIETKNRGMVAAFLMGLVWIVSESIGISLSGVLADLFTQDAPAKALACLGAFLFIGSYFAYRLVSLQQTKQQLVQTELQNRNSSLI